jgi:hypothetical protein
MRWLATRQRCHARTAQTDPSAMIRDIAATPRPSAVAPTPEATPTAEPRRTDAVAGSAAAPMLPNPRLRIDAALNIVVLEFRDDGGAISRTLPSAQEIKAYRDGAAESGAETQPALDVQR